MVALLVMRYIPASPGAPRACVDFRDPTAVSRFKRYMSLLQATFLFKPLPAWSSNLGKRLIKSPKIHLIDSGLTAHLAGITRLSLDRDPVFFGHLFENFVVNALYKQIGWSDSRVNLYHYRTTTGREVDILLEDVHPLE